MREPGYYKVEIVDSNNKIKRFIRFPSKIYNKHELNQDKKVERQILTGKHPLSHYFDAVGFIVTSNNDNEVVARCIVTLYKDDTNAYVGFFESIDNVKAVRELFNSVEEYAIAHNKSRLIGPVDGSFWIKYRFKITEFANYTLEPTNKPYYPDLWQGIGFGVYEKYYSNQLRIPTESDRNPKYRKRLLQFIEAGYTIRNTSRKTFDTDLKNIYKLLIEVYAKFPIFKHIEEKEFLKLFSKIRYILDYRMVFLAYKESELLGFMVCIPNYKRETIIQSLLGKHKEYVMMYLGASRHAPGLGGAFSELCRANLAKYKCSCIAALIHKGNTSGTFYKELTTDTCNYVLLSKEI